MAEQPPDSPRNEPQGSNCCFTAAATFGMVAALAALASGMLVRRLR